MIEMCAAITIFDGLPFTFLEFTYLVGVEISSRLHLAGSDETLIMLPTITFGFGCSITPIHFTIFVVIYLFYKAVGNKKQDKN